MALLGGGGEANSFPGGAIAPPPRYIVKKGTVPYPIEQKLCLKVVTFCYCLCYI